MTEEKRLNCEEKILAFYVKLLSDRRGPVDRMVLDPIIEEYVKYFEIKFK